MNWNEAYIEMKKGNKVRMSTWIDKNQYAYFIDNNLSIILNCGTLLDMSTVFLDAENWELFIEKKTLTTIEEIEEALEDYSYLGFRITILRSETWIDFFTANIENQTYFDKQLKDFYKHYKLDICGGRA